MANVTTTARAKIITVTGFTIANVPMAVANTEYSYTLPNNTKKFLFRMRVSSICKLAYISGNSGLIYVTLNPNTVYYKENLDLSGVTIYFQSSVGSQTAEIETGQ